jgi:YgiT-type zinc finger domain-containing protein
MKCVICKGDNIVQKEVAEHIENGNNIVEFNVKILVCQNCGERYYDRKTMKVLEDTREKVKNGSLNIEPVGQVFQVKQL